MFDSNLPQNESTGVLNRRGFIAATAAGALLGCGRQTPYSIPGAAMPNAIDRKLLEMGVARWPSATAQERRTTPKPPIDVLEILPEIAGTERTAVRLHPRYCANLPPGASKLGGRFLWPADDPWPMCPKHREPCVAVLQLNAAEFPEMQFPPGADLFQLFWCAVEPGWPDHYHASWRRAADVANVLAQAPTPSRPDESLLPVPCILLPERIQEYPSFEALTSEQQERLRRWKPDDALLRILDQYDYDSSVSTLYDWELSDCPGTKIGGYVGYFGSPYPKEQTRAGRELPYLLTVSGQEYGLKHHQRWRPIEDRDTLSESASHVEFETFYHKVMWHRRAISPAQLFGEDGRIHFFVDRDAEGWPVYEESDVS